MTTLTNLFLEYVDHFLALILSGFLAYIVGYVYQRYGHSLSNRRAFARNFLPVAMSTTLIIIIVKGSIALSLGLVGALSIVRFRAAIKEPEEIAYLFLVIAIGIGLGAFQFAVTIIAAPIILAVIAVRSHLSGKVKRSSIGKYNINIISKKIKQSGIVPLTKLVENQTTAASLKHYSEDEDSSSLLFHANFENIEALDVFRSALLEFESAISVDIVKNRE